MLKMTPTLSAKNLLSDMAEDAEVGSGTSSTTRSAENLSASVDMAEDAEVGESDGGDNEMVKKITFQEVKRTYKLKDTIWKATKQSFCRAHVSL